MTNLNNHYDTIKDGMNGFERTIKRAADIVLSCMGLIILSPLYLLIIIVLKAQRNGPAFYRQERMGYQGQPFHIIKFRTMKQNFENQLEPQLFPNTDHSQSTPFELFLRTCHLDELPQLWNVLVGDMSVVGPRPERLFFINKIREHDDRYDIIYLMRPGLTSEATVYNGYTDTMEKMLRRLQMDIEYYEKRSLLLDVRIMAVTVLHLFKRH